MWHLTLHINHVLLGYCRGLPISFCHVLEYTCHMGCKWSWRMRASHVTIFKEKVLFCVQIESPLWSLHHSKANSKIYVPWQYCKSMSRGFLGTQLVDILVFPSPTGYMLTTCGFSLLNWEISSLNSSKISLKWWVIFLKSWPWTGYSSNSTSSSIPSGWLSPFIGANVRAFWQVGKLVFEEALLHWSISCWHVYYPIPWCGHFTPILVRVDHNTKIYKNHLLWKTMNILDIQQRK